MVRLPPAGTQIESFQRSLHARYLQALGQPAEMPAESLIKLPASPPIQPDSPRLVASSDRVRRELGWQPKHPSLEEIIASAWEWHRTNPKGYDE